MNHIDDDLALKEYPALKKQRENTMSAIMQTELAQLAAQAYNETKPKDDPVWSDVHGVYRDKLMTHAQAIENGYPSLNPTPFEKRVSELIQERQDRTYSQNVKAEQDAILKQKTESIEAAKVKFDEELKVDKENAKAAVAVAKEIEKNDPAVGSGQSTETQTQWKDSGAREAAADYKGDEGEKGKAVSEKGSAGKAAAKGSEAKGGKK